MAQTREATILISPRPDGRWRWAGPGVQVESTATESQPAWYADLRDHASLVLLVPGEEVFLADVPMPTRHPERIRQALPFALEEHVLDDPARLHCVAGPRTTKDSIACAAIDRARLAGMLDDLAGAGLAPDRACPDSLCIPWEPGSIEVVHSGDRSLVRWGPCAAAACDESTARVLIEGVQAANPAASLRVEERRVDDVQELVDLHLAEAARMPLDFLQGEFLPEGKKGGWRTWRLPAALAAGAIILLLIIEGLQTRQYHAVSVELGDAIAEEFRATFPHIGRVQADPAPQVEMELRRLRARAGDTRDIFLDLLMHAAPALSAEPGIRLDSLQYDSGELELGLTSGEIADLDRLRDRLRSADFSAQQGAAQLIGGRVSGTIRISARGTGAGS